MMLKNQIMKLQTYKMYEGEDTVYVERDDVLKILEQQPCEDCISRAEAEAIFKNARKSLYELSRKEQVKDFQTREMMLLNAEQFIHLLPSVTPSYNSIKTELKPCEDCIRGRK